jgi:hypothetical protein
MSWTMGMVKARVRSLLDDPNGTYITDSFIVPLINETYDDVCSQMESTQSSWDIAVVEVPAIPAGTPNLEQFQLGTGPLSNLTDQPLRIDWKPAGNDPSYYQLVPNYDVLPDWQPQQGVFGWEFRSEVIWLGNCSINVDLRIRGEFSPPPLTDDTSVLSAHPRIGFAVAYGTAALIAVVRGNDAWATKYQLEAQTAIDEILQEIVRSEQGQVRRIGRQTQRGRRGTNWVAYQ